MKNRKQHPVTILFNMGNILYLLLLPVIRVAFFAICNIPDWISGAWFDAAVVAVIILIAVARWFLSRFDFSEKGVFIRKGLFMRSIFFIPQGKLSTLVFEHSFYLKPFHAITIRMDSDAGSYKKADVSLIVSRSTAKQIEEISAAFNHNYKYIDKKYQPKGLYIAALSAIFSNSFAGIIFAATLISQAGRLIGKEFERGVMNRFAHFASAMAFGLPPATALVAYLLVGGWLIAFIQNLIKYKNFTAEKEKNSLVIHSGLFTNRTYRIQADHINFLDITQSILAKILRLYTVLLHSAGFGKQKEDVSVLIPASNKSSLDKAMKSLVPTLRMSRNILEPPKRAFMRFLWDPVWVAAVLALAAFVLRRIFVTWADFIFYIALILAAPCAWFFLVRLVDFITTGIGLGETSITLRYSKLFYLHTVIIPKEKISLIVLRQSVFQMFDNACDVIVYAFSEQASKHRVKNLDKKSVIEALELSPDWCGFKQPDNGQKSSFLRKLLKNFIPCYNVIKNQGL